MDSLHTVNQGSAKYSLAGQIQSATFFCISHDLKITFYIFKCLKKVTRRGVFCDTWKLYEIQILLSINKVFLKCRESHLLTHYLWLLWCFNGLTYLLSSHLQKEFAKPSLIILGFNNLIEVLVEKNWTKVNLLGFMN